MARVSRISVDKTGLQAGRVDGWRESMAGDVFFWFYFLLPSRPCGGDHEMSLSTHYDMMSLLLFLLFYFICRYRDLGLFGFLSL